jgi:hypothetical protein
LVVEDASILALRASALSASSWMRSSDMLVSVAAAVVVAAASNCLTRSCSACRATCYAVHGLRWFTHSCHIGNSCCTLVILHGQLSHSLGHDTCTHGACISPANCGGSNGMDGGPTTRHDTASLVA